MSSQQTRQQVLELHNQMFISPQDFSYRWGLGYEQLAQICCLSKSTTYHWLGGQASRREAGLPYQRIMAMADFLLTNAERVQPLLERWHTTQ
ncbi:helix-turn-helix domain-containing protein [Cyanobacteria bacterium FACHB-472]|nr:helix-turn-helix domain-containing protein [Cyanobacteria bacterium FACHB-472]